MADSRPLGPDQLRSLLKRLEDVMAEAHRLREQVARQLAERAERITPIKRRPRKRS
jgi:hypothetical protein